MSSIPFKVHVKPHFATSYKLLQDIVKIEVDLSKPYLINFHSDSQGDEIDRYHDYLLYSRVLGAFMSQHVSGKPEFLVFDSDIPTYLKFFLENISESSDFAFTFTINSDAKTIQLNPE